MRLNLRRRAATTLAAVAVVPLVAAAVTTVAGAAPVGARVPATGQYVALGDSYSSGEGAPGKGRPHWLKGTNVDGDQCHRSPVGWPELVEQQSAPGSRLSFHACSGALVADFYHANHENPHEVKPQLDWLGQNTSTVTYTIGGNDAHFADVMEYCALRARSMPTCRATWSAQVDAAIAQLAGEHNNGTLRQLGSDAATRAPDAHILVVGYPRLFPSSPPTSCPTGVPGFRFWHVDMEWMNAETAKLDEAAKRAALATPNASYVATFGGLAGHDLCASHDRWINRADLDHIEFSYHPDRRGQQAIAALVEHALTSP